MKAYLIKAEMFANGAPCPHAGQWIETFDHDAEGGRGYGTFTSDAWKAMRFNSHAEALMFWHKQSSVRPLRADGEPNRPLTSLTCSIEPYWQLLV